MTDTVDAPAASRIPHWIGGRRVEGGSGRSGPVFNPATGRQAGAVDFAAVEEVDAAVQAAKDAFPGWRATSLAKRAELFFRIRELLHARREEAAEILVREHGKVFSDALGEVTRGLALVEHPDVAAISFVGSTPVARAVYEKATAGGKRCQALGGAKNHMIVLPDADVSAAADAAVSAGYGSAGERCMAVSVVVAVGDVADPLVDAIKERLPKVKIGPGTEPENEMGPLITREHRDKVASYIDGAREQGATVVSDGRELDVDGDGFFLGVSLLDGVTPEMDAYRDEIFGPVLSLVRAKTYDEAVQLVNDNPYGNGVAIFTRDGGAARQFQFEVGAGMVGVNVPIPVPVAYYSFGGWKSSLFGDLHLYGPEGIQFYTRGKVVTSRWPDPGTTKVDLGFPRTR